MPREFVILTGTEPTAVGFGHGISRAGLRPRRTETVLQAVDAAGEVVVTVVPPRRIQTATPVDELLGEGVAGDARWWIECVSSLQTDPQVARAAVAGIAEGVDGRVVVRNMDEELG